MQILKIYNTVQAIGMLKNRKVRLDFTTKKHSILVKKTICGQMKLVVRNSLWSSFVDDIGSTINTVQAMLLPMELGH